MFISDKQYDWFRYWNNSDEYKKKRDNKILNIQIDNKISKLNIQIDSSKLYCVGDLLYGQKFYWDDILKDPDTIIKNFIAKDFKKDYPYFYDHPMYGNTYSSTQKDIGDKIIELKTNSNFKNTSKDINMFLHNNHMKIYAKEYVNVNLQNNEIIMNIIKRPYKNNKLVSYGVHFETAYYKNNCELMLEFEIKINENEIIYPRVYTGLKWITLDTELSEKYKKYIVKDIFNFRSRSDWRISTTSVKVGQIIFIKNISFIDEK